MCMPTPSCVHSSPRFGRVPCAWRFRAAPCPISTRMSSRLRATLHLCHTDTQCLHQAAPLLAYARDLRLADELRRPRPGRAEDSMNPDVQNLIHALSKPETRWPGYLIGHEVDIKPRAQMPPEQLVRRPMVAIAYDEENGAYTVDAGQVQFTATVDNLIDTGRYYNSDLIPYEAMDRVWVRAANVTLEVGYTRKHLAMQASAMETMLEKMQALGCPAYAIEHNRRILAQHHRTLMKCNCKSRTCIKQLLVERHGSEAFTHEKWTACTGTTNFGPDAMPDAESGGQAASSGQA